MTRLSDFCCDGTADEALYMDFMRDLDSMDKDYGLSDNDEYELHELEVSGILDGCDYDDPEDEDDVFGCCGGRCVGFDDYDI